MVQALILWDFIFVNSNNKMAAVKIKHKLLFQTPICKICSQKLELAWYLYFSLYHLLVCMCSGACMTQYPFLGQERLVFQVGARLFSACPIFSQHSAGDKHKVGGPGTGGAANLYMYTWSCHTPPSSILPFSPLAPFSPSSVSILSRP